jgi:hypothetical protein
VTALRVGRLLTLAGAVLLVAGTLTPINGGGDAGYGYALYDNPVDLNLRWFALEPLGVALGVVLVLVVSLRWRERALYALLVAAGAQTAVFFFGYLGHSMFAPDAYNSPAAGSILGLAGAALVVAGGVTGFAVERRRDRSAV